MRYNFKEFLLWSEGIAGYFCYLWFSGIDWNEFFSDAKHFFAACGTALALGAMTKLGHFVTEKAVQKWKNRKQKRKNNFYDN